jgi:hypothetical protein
MILIIGFWWIMFNVTILAYFVLSHKFDNIPRLNILQVTLLSMLVWVIGTYFIFK